MGKSVVRIVGMIIMCAICMSVCFGAPRNCPPGGAPDDKTFFAKSDRMCAPYIFQEVEGWVQCCYVQQWTEEYMCKDGLLYFKIKDVSASYTAGACEEPFTGEVVEKEE